jgi:hypothetical protein
MTLKDISSHFSGGTGIIFDEVLEEQLFSY